MTPLTPAATTFLDPNTVDLRNPPPLVPYMPPAEYEWLLAHMQTFDVLVEVGGGLGTFYWDRNLDCTMLYTIESDPAWYRLIAALGVLASDKVPSFRHAYAFLLIFGNGHPDGPLFDAIKRFENPSADICVFLDGPNRVEWGRWLAEHVQCPVLIHDWNRAEYKELLDDYTVKDELLDGQGCALLVPTPPF